MLERLAHYNLLGRLGAGGMGELYRARDTRHGRTVALRILAPSIRDDAARREAFARDAARAAALSHPNIALLYETSEDQGELFAAFEFVPGETLRATIAVGPLNPRRAIQLGAQIADALADAHAHGVAHGGLNPDRVIVTPKGAAKLIDFGLTQWCGESSANTSDFDPRADLTALGTLLSEMLSGAPSSAGARPPAVPAELEPILRKAGMPRDGAEYQSAAMLAADLRAADAAIAVRQEASAANEVPLERISRPRARRGRTIGIAAAASVAALALWSVRSPLSRSVRRAVASPPRPVVVVLPFDRPDGPPDYWSAGLAGDIGARLGQMSGVQVVARTAAVGLSAEAARTSSIRAGAGAILGGTVRTDGDRVRVALVLTRAESTDPLLQGDYERDVKDVFALQLQIASDVARALGVAVTPTAAAERDAARQVDPAAYEDYLRGRVAAVNGNDDAAAESYARALTVDDGLAEAHAAYAEALYRRAPADPVAADAERSLIKRAAARAVELAPDLPAANLAAGAAAESVADALTALHSAVRTDPSFAEAYRAIAAEIADLDPERSRRFQQKAAMLDPALDANRQIPTPSPDACEVLMERMAATSSRRSASADRQQALAAMARADSRDAGPHVLRCAALAAAALGRAGAAGALLQRIASTDAAFRLWTTSAGTRSTYRIEAQTFPWSRVYGQPPFIEAKSALDQADRRARERIADILQDLQF